MIQEIHPADDNPATGNAMLQARSWDAGKSATLFTEAAHVGIDDSQMQILKLSKEPEPAKRRFFDTEQPCWEAQNGRWYFDPNVSVLANSARSWALLNRPVHGSLRPLDAHIAPSMHRNHWKRIERNDNNFNRQSRLAILMSVVGAAAAVVATLFAGHGSLPPPTSRRGLSASSANEREMKPGEFLRLAETTQARTVACVPALDNEPAMLLVRMNCEPLGLEQDLGGLTLIP